MQSSEVDSHKSHYQWNRSRKHNKCGNLCEYNIARLQCFAHAFPTTGLTSHSTILAGAQKFRDATIVQRRMREGIRSGRSQREVASMFHVAPSTINRLSQRRQQTGSVRDRPRPGSLLVTTPLQDRNIIQTHNRNRFLPASTTAANLVGRHGRAISAFTVIRQLRTAGMTFRRPWCIPIWRLQPGPACTTVHF